MEPVNSCTDCGLVFDSSKSLDVHLSYHKENLLSKWGSSATSGGGGPGSGGSEANNNVNVKKEKVQPDSSDFLFDFQQQQDFRQQLHQQQQQQQMISRGYRFHPYGYERQVSSSQVTCEKCGLTLEASQLVEHNAQMHPWEEPQAEILDLDSHKVHVYQPPEDTPPWRYFKEENGNTSPELGGVSTTTNAGGNNDLFNYDPSPQQKFLPKAAAWKSNEARRPKTYNCSACNKWFTSSGHLKRHYNTTLHKNAVKQSGGLDPAAMPVASHHHPPSQSQQQPPPQQQQQEESSSSSSSSWHQPQQQSSAAPAAPQPTGPPALYAHPPPPEVAPPPPSAYFIPGYHHPNGEPPRHMLPSFSQLTGVSYDRLMAGGLDDHREVVLEMHHQVQHPHQQAVHQDLHTSISKQLLSTQLMPVYLPPPPVATCTDTLLVGNENNGTSRPQYRTSNRTTSPSYSPAYDPATAVVSSTQEDASAQVHKCLDCDKTFNKACYLTQHNKSFHAGVKPYKCIRCGKRFTQEYLHLEHLSKHAGEKPHKCEICPKQFNHKTDLRRHMCLHSGDKPYACHICGKGFIRKDHMLKHCETHRKKLTSGHKKEEFLRSMVAQQVMQQ